MDRATQIERYLRSGTASANAIQAIAYVVEESQGGGDAMATLIGRSLTGGYASDNRIREIAKLLEHAELRGDLEYLVSDEIDELSF